MFLSADAVVEEEIDADLQQSQPANAERQQLTVGGDVVARRIDVLDLFTLSVISMPTMLNDSPRMLKIASAQLRILNLSER